MSLLSRLLPLPLFVGAVLSQNYVIEQPLGPDTFGPRSSGQIFTPSVGIVPSPGTPATLPLTKFTLHHGNLGAQVPSATTYLNIYDGDPNNGGVFVGSSTNSIDTTAAAGWSYGDPLVWHFAQLPLDFTTAHWAIMSSVATAGIVPVEVSLQTADRNGPDVYLGGAGIVGNLAAQAAGRDTTFAAEFVIGQAASFTTSLSGCPGALGQSHLSSPTFPQLGKTFVVEMDNVSPTAVPLMVVGLSDTSWGGASLPLPISLALPAAPNCNLLVSLDLVVTMATVGDRASWSLAVPNNVALLGYTMFQQGAQLDVGPDFSVTEKATAIVGY